MSKVLDYVRSKVPDLASVDDDDLALYIADRKPEFLDDPEFQDSVAKAKVKDIVPGVKPSIAPEFKGIEHPVPTPNLEDLAPLASETASREARYKREGITPIEFGFPGPHLPRIPQQQGVIPQIGAGLGNAAIGLGEFMLQPENAAFAAMPYSAAARAALSPVIAKDIASNIIPQLKTTYQSAANKDYQTAAQEAANLALEALLAKHALGPVKEVRTLANMLRNKPAMPNVDEAAIRALRVRDAVTEPQLEKGVAPDEVTSPPEPGGVTPISEYLALKRFLPADNPMPGMVGSVTPIDRFIKRNKPEISVPGTAPEPERSLTVIEEIRQKNAQTKEQVRALFPQLSREQAAELRRLAWGKPPPQPDPAPQKPVINVSDIVKALDAGDTKKARRLAKQIETESSDVPMSIFNLEGEPNAIQKQAPDAVPVQPAPGDSGAVGEGVREAVKEPAGAKAEEAAPVGPEESNVLLDAIASDVAAGKKLTPEQIDVVGKLTPEQRQAYLDLVKQKKVTPPNETVTPPAPSPKPAPVEPEANSAQEISGAFQGIGKGITGSFYDQAFKALQAGSDTISGVKDPILQKAKPFFDQGKIKSPEDLRALAQGGFKEEPASPPPEPTAEKPAAPAGETAKGQSLSNRISESAKRRINTFAELSTLTQTHRRLLSDVVNPDAQAAYDYALEQSKRDWEDKKFKRGFERIAKYIKNQWPIKETPTFDSGKPTFDSKQTTLGPTGGAGPGTPSAAQGPDPKAQIEQLADAFKGSKAPLKDRVEALVKGSFSLGEKLTQAKDAVARALAGLKTTGEALKKTITGFDSIDDMLKAKGELSAELEKRGWRVRAFVQTVKNAIPDVRRRNAIAKWVDSGGDAATLQQGLASTQPKYRQAYQDALNLKGDDLIHAQNIQNFFQSRLQEAIDAGVLEHGIEDYLHRMYPKDSPFKQQAIAYVQSGILSQNPSLARKRIFKFDWEAEQAGYQPVQDFLPRIAEYETSLSRAIAARAFVAKLAQMKAPDGRPIIGIKGVGVPIEDPATGDRTGTIIKPLGDFKKNTDPNDAKNYRGDYINREYNALSKWKWVAEDSDGKPIFLKGDVAIHPDFKGRIDALLEPSRVRYGRYPRLGQTLLGLSSTFKNTMLDLSGFHHVQIALHAMEHRVMPWHILKDIDFENPNVEGLLRGGVTLGGEYRQSNLSEGLIGSSLSRHVPVLGPIMEAYHSYLFQSLIPRIKMTMALDALGRNRTRFAKDLASGKMKEGDLYKLTADQANAAFGEQNYIMLERSKTAQDMLRLIFLAPDFLEARGRFAGQSLTKYGTEQRVALALGAVTMYTLARIINKVLDDQYHFEPENLFNVVYKGNSYGLRTVQGDILHLIEKPVQFWMSRLNPLYGRTAMEVATGRDWFGRKRSVPEQVWDSVSNIVPIAVRSNRERSMWESTLNAFGVTARRYNDVDDAFKLAQKWKDKHGIQQRGEFIYDPDKDPLRSLKIALTRQDEAGAAKEIQRLIQSKATTMAKLNQYFERYASMPFTGSRLNDRKFITSLSEDERKTVESGRQTKQRILKLFRTARNQYYQSTRTP